MSNFLQKLNEIPLLEGEVPEGKGGNYIITDSTLSRNLLFQKLNQCDKIYCEFSFWGATNEHHLTLATNKVIGEKNLFFSENGQPADKKTIREDDYDDGNHIFVLETKEVIHKRSNSVYFLSQTLEGARKLRETYTKLINTELNKLTKKTVLNNKINLLMKSDSYYFQRVDINIDNVRDLDLELHYGTGFKKKSDMILDNLLNKHKGLYLIHGKMGAGKTTYLRYLTSRIHEKKVIFIPPYFTDFLSSPEFLPTLVSDYGARNSILIIEDAEKVVMSREDGNNNSNCVSALLNISDGILSDSLSCSVIATFNTKVDNIDSALLRKGRLICEHTFNALSISDSQKLVDKLAEKGILQKFKVTKEMTLAEIYGAEQENFHEEKVERKIGFKQ